MSVGVATFILELKSRARNKVTNHMHISRNSEERHTQMHSVCAGCVATAIHAFYWCLRRFHVLMSHKILLI